ncbi:hypothetical protein DE146DRAFT_667318 [Phaeosphaeria sp. MPI-PUGE-AT-0046c]|nr:hypothetical protein DE146DRAFT_667318 [Phaeosphaeria sp. MPI-PUGE-AT-0046c]
MFSKSVALASLFSTAIAGPVAALQARAALPAVEIKALPAGCASYPNYNADTKIAGPWSITVAAAENPDLVNYGTSTSYSLAIENQRPVMRWGYVNLGFAFGIARSWYQCQSDKLHVQADTKVNGAGGPQEPKLTPVALSPYPYDASLLYLIDGEQPTLYEHFIDGQKQDGYFLGGYETTTWGVQWQEADSTSYFLPYFYMRLLPEGQELKTNETRVHIKIQV